MYPSTRWTVRFERLCTLPHVGEVTLWSIDETNSEYRVLIAVNPKYQRSGDVVNLKRSLKARLSEARQWGFCFDFDAPCVSDVKLLDDADKRAWVAVPLAHSCGTHWTIKHRVDNAEGGADA